MAEDIRAIPLTLATGSTKGVVDMELKSNPAKHATQAPMNMVVGDKPMTGIFMGEVTGNRPVTAEGVTSNKAMTRLTVAANKNPTSLILRTTVPDDERMKGMAGAGRTERKFAPLMA